MRELIDVGHAYAGILVTWDDGTFTVVSHGKGDRREVSFQEDPDAAAVETLTQARVLSLMSKLPRVGTRQLASWLAAESVKQ